MRMTRKDEVRLWKKKEEMETIKYKKKQIFEKNPRHNPKSGRGQNQIICPDRRRREEMKIVEETIVGRS